ncbi:MAG: RsmD family RNA methyltransferase, partial [Spirochaetota bacterium]
SFGLECISRGCNKVSFIEKDKRATDIIKRNLSLINEKADLINYDVIKYLKKNKDISLYDVIFLDPPYKEDLGINTILLLDISNQLHDNVLIIYEHNVNNIKNVNEMNLYKLEITKSKKYGNSALTFFINKK